MNRIHQNGTELSAEEYAALDNAAASLESRMKAHFLKHPGKHTWEDMQRVFPYDREGSINRSLTNLFKSGFLFKDERIKKLGSSRVSLCTYQLRQVGQLTFENLFQ